MKLTKIEIEMILTIIQTIISLVQKLHGQGTIQGFSSRQIDSIHHLQDKLAEMQKEAE